MKSVIFDVAPFYGHYNPALGLATILQKNGYDVMFIGDKKFAKLITSEGFKYLSFNIPNKLSRNNTFSFGLYEILGLPNFAAWSEHVDRYMSIIKHQNPDLVILDDDTDHKLLWYKAHSINVTTFSTKPYGGPDHRLPPYNYYLPVAKNIQMKALYYLLWKYEGLKNRFKYCEMNIKSFRRNDMYFSIMYLNHILKVKEKPDFNYVFKSAFYHKDPKLILIPRRFEFNRILPANVHELNVYGVKDKQDVIKDRRYISIINKITSKKDDSIEPQRVIYASMGTLSKLFKEKMMSFFSVLKQVAETRSDELFIISIGENIRLDFLNPVPKNLYVFNSVPQWHLLKFTNIMINHGGMNSVLECVANKVPQLVYPLSDGWEQNGNAQKVKYHDIGQIGKFKSISVREISDKLDSLIFNIDRIKSNLEELNSAIANDFDENLVQEVIGKTINKNL